MSKQPIEPSMPKLDEILTKSFNDFYDYITEKDIIKAAHEYSEKTVYKNARQSILAIMAQHGSTLKAEYEEKVRQARIDELNTLSKTEWAYDEAFGGYLKERIAELEREEQ